MKKIKFTYLILLIFPLFLFGQSDSEIIRIPDFMEFSSISYIKNDTITKTCFCFDKFDKQIYHSGIYNNIADIEYCRVFKNNYNKERSFWKYEQFIKATDNEVFAEYFNIDNANWLMKKYKNNLVISENNVKVTDEVTGLGSFYGRRTPSEPFIITEFEVLKTEIVD